MQVSDSFLFGVNEIIRIYHEINGLEQTYIAVRKDDGDDNDSNAIEREVAGGADAGRQASSSVAK